MEFLDLGTSYPINQTSLTFSAKLNIESFSCPGSTFPLTYWLKSFLFSLILNFLQ